MKKSELRSVIRSIIKEQSGADPNQLLADAGQYCPPNQGYMQGFGPVCNISCPNQNDQALMNALGQGNSYQFVFNVCNAQLMSQGVSSATMGSNNCCTGVSSWHNSPLSNYMYFFDQVCDGNGGYNYGYYPWSGGASMPWYVPASDPSSCTSQCADFGCQGQGGCTDPDYVEYDANATFDDGSYATLAPVPCTDPLYVECGNTQGMPCNNLVSDTQAGIDNQYPEGCADSSADNYDPNAYGCAVINTGPPANACGVTYTLYSPSQTQCCTYSSTSGNTNYMPGGVGNVTGPTGPTATLSTKDIDLSKPPQAGASSADMTAKKDRMQKLANIKSRRKK
jgi:hypothetical protein